MTNGTREGKLCDFGGRRESTDGDAFVTAARELCEEIGGDLFGDAIEGAAGREAHSHFGQRKRLRRRRRLPHLLLTRLRIERRNHQRELAAQAAVALGDGAKVRVRGAQRATKEIFV